MFLHPVGVSLAESFNLVSNICRDHDVVIDDVPRCVDDDSEVFFLKSLVVSMFDLEAVPHNWTP